MWNSVFIPAGENVIANVRVHGHGGGMEVVGVPVQEEHSLIDLPQHVDTARGSRSKLRRMAATV